MRTLFRSLLPLSFLLLAIGAAAQCDMRPDSPRSQNDGPESPKPVSPKQDAAKPATKAEPAFQMMTYQLVLFRESPTATPPATMPERIKLMRGHLANLAALNRSRIALLYGPFADPAADSASAPAPSMKGLVGLAVLDVADAATAKNHFDADPMVQSGNVVLEVKPWFAPKGFFHEPTSPATDDPRTMSLEPLVFGVLVRGPAAKAVPQVHTEAQRQEFQKGHLAYMGELNKQGKLISAGPFMPGPSGDAGDWRGVVIYRVASVDEAQRLAAGDPSVNAGRLALEARSWMTLKGMLK